MRRLPVGASRIVGWKGGDGMALPSATEVEPSAERPRVGRCRVGRKLLGLATVFVGAAFLVGAAAGWPLDASRSEACNPGGPLPGKAALRACAGLYSPKESLEYAGDSSGVVTLHSPFSGYSTTIAVNHKSNTECQHEGAACVFHHWNWGGEFLGDIAVAGCGANDLTCKVDLNHLGFGARWATVTVMLDDNNQNNEVAFAVSTNAPPVKKPEGSLSVVLSTSAQSWKLAVGGTAGVTAKVTAQDGPVGSIRLGLSTSGVAVDVTHEPAGAKSFSLGKGSSGSFTFELKGLADGTSMLVALADGKTAAGKAVSAYSSAELVVGSIGPTAIDWEMPPRTTSSTVEEAGKNLPLGLPTAAWVNPMKWTATLFTRTKSGSQFDCGSDTRFVWEVKPANLLVEGKQPRVACSSKLNVTRQGTFKVTAQMQKHLDGAWRDVGSPLAGKVVVKDWLVVGMGDSNGSGEGDPPFYFERCNRSLSSYQVQTAIALEERDPHTSVTFIHLSCSGARIEHLWHTQYPGTRAASPPLPPQFEQLDYLLTSHGDAPRRKVDIALISIGVNDLSFGPVLTYCVKDGAQTTAELAKHPCQKDRVSKTGDPGTLNGVKEYVADPNGSSTVAEPLEDWVDIKQKALVSLYDDLAPGLSQLGMNSTHVLMA